MAFLIVSVVFVVVSAVAISFSFLGLGFVVLVSSVAFTALLVMVIRGVFSLFSMDSAVVTALGAVIEKSAFSCCVDAVAGGAAAGAVVHVIGADVAVAVVAATGGWVMPDDGMGPTLFHISGPGK